MTPATAEEALLLAARSRYTITVLRGADYLTILLKDDQPIIAADGLPVQYRSQREADIDMAKRARYDVAQAATCDPAGDDPAPETGLGSSDDEGDSYDEEREVSYAAA